MTLPSTPEIVANLLVTASIVLAARNSIHVWWTTIAGCAVFAWVFFEARLYADVLLQFFFVAIAVAGWWNWLRGDHGKPAPVRWTSAGPLIAGLAASLAFAAGWAFLTSRYTDAAAPIPDSLVLGLSAFAQLLMMARRVENWPAWIVVNTIAVPLFWSRGLHLTAGLYVFYWLNAWWAFFHWRRLAREARPA
jgi:nicotinamide mononucleotide transporter